MEKVAKPEGDFVPPLPEETYDRAQADFVFDTRVWLEIIAKSKPSQLAEPIAYLVGGQPGSGKSRMATTLIAAHPHQLIYGDTGNLFGFHRIIMSCRHATVSTAFTSRNILRNIS